MKKILLSLVALMLATLVFAQSPQKINYQAIVRNATGDPVVNQNVALRLSVLDQTATGSALYVETHSVTTNAFGLVNLQIGGGTPSSGSFSTINWALNSKFLKVEADVTGGSTFTLLTTTELVSVPYALHAGSSQDNQWTLSGNDITSKNSGNIGLGGTPNASAKLDISASNKGILIPRVTLANRPASPTNGLLIYQTDNTPGFYYYSGSAWIRMADNNDIPPTAVTGSIVPYASGLPVALTTVLGGLLNTSSIIGFGSGATGISTTGGVINLTGAAGTLLNFAFVAPRAGTITSLAAQFSTTAGLSLVGSTVTPTAQLYSAPAGSNSFTAVSGATVVLPGLTGVLALGTIRSGITTGLNIQVNAGTRYILVFGAQVTSGIDIATTVAGYASAGLNIN